MKQVLLLLILFVTSISFGQTNRYFHEFETTASDFHIVKWNIEAENLPNKYVEEIVDENNRVIELKFFRNRTLEYDRLCYISVWIKFEYPNDKTIIEYYLDSNGNENAEIECGMPSRNIYTLSKDYRNIVKTESEYNFNKAPYIENGWTEEELKNAIVSLKSEKRMNYTVAYYSKSYFKMNKKFPVSGEFQIDNFRFSDQENEEILKIIKVN